MLAYELIPNMESPARWHHIMNVNLTLTQDNQTTPNWIPH